MSLYILCVVHLSSSNVDTLWITRLISYQFLQLVSRDQVYLTLRGVSHVLIISNIALKLDLNLQP